MSRVDFSSRGPEPFQFESVAAGMYRIEVSPFERQTGRYTLTMRRVEPVATRPADRVDQIMAGFANPATPGAVVAVIRNGEVAFSRAYGAANLEHSIPFRVDTRTNIGSTSKQFTAFAIELLAQRGELSLDDDVREHLPELPDLGKVVTIRHLLTHTSGYREFLNTLALSGRRLDHGDWIERDEIVRMVQRQPELQNDPGAEWNYNNTGFALLARIVERKSGMDFADFLRENVFEPLGFTSVPRALADQLGLALVESEAPYDVIVIDQAERP
jgi:CubicO group peptidase (beta-lactamase class C family)